MDNYQYPQNNYGITNYQQQQIQLMPEDMSRMQADLFHYQAESFIQQQRTQEAFNREEIKTQAILRREQAKLDMREQARDERELRVLKVLQEADGRIYLAIKNPQREVFVQQIFISEELLAANRYYTVYPESTTVFALAFRKDEKQINIFYSPTSDGNNGKKLLAELELAGLHISVSRRLKNGAADALYSFICEKAKDVEIAARYGFNLHEDGSWYFCEPGEITLEVLENG